MKINDLEIDLDVEGWGLSGGRSENVWGQVPTKNLPIEKINEAISQNRKSCIWTCFDDALYKTDGNGKLLPASLDNVPKTISATFKPTFEKFSAIAENISMQIAVALDIPTSYNYIVKFDKEKHPKIMRHFSSPSKRDKVQPIGLVSVDFLKMRQTKAEISGEELISFSESVFRVKSDLPSGGNEFLIKNWIKSLDMLAKKYVPNFPEEKLNEQLERVNSRIVRSFLFREFLGDCDYTDRNSGFVIDDEQQTLQYAPNFDYGESFNSLIKTKLDFLPPEDELKEILKWDKNYFDKKIAKQKETLTESLAQKFSADSSAKNILFVAKNYPNDTKEFLKNLVEAIKQSKFDKIIDEYTYSTSEDDPLLSNEEAKMFKIYLNTRAGWMQNHLSHDFENRTEKTL